MFASVDGWMEECELGVGQRPAPLFRGPEPFLVTEEGAWPRCLVSAPLGFSDPIQGKVSTVFSYTFMLFSAWQFGYPPRRVIVGP